MTTTHPKVQEKLLALTKLKPKADESAEDFTSRVLKKVNTLADANSDNWEELGGAVEGLPGSDPAQDWVNKNVTAQSAGTELALLELPEEEEEVVAQEEESADADVEEESEVSTPVDKKEKKSVAKVKATKGVKVAAKKVVAKKAVSVKKTAPAKKAAAKKAATAAGERRGRKSKFKPDAKIKLLVKGNPHREGTKLRSMYEKYKNGITVEALLRAGIPLSNINYLTKIGSISVS